MRILAGLLIAVCFLPSCLIAQTNEADISARLVGAPLYLRGLWAADKLAFDTAGELKGTSPVASFTLSGMDVTAIKLSSKGLALEGQRVGLTFDKDTPRRMGLRVPKKPIGTDPEKMEIEIERPANGDYTAALGAVFTEDLADLVPAMPPCWQSYAQKHFLPVGPSGWGTGSAAVGADAARNGLRRIGGGVKQPVVIYQVEPNFSQAARAQKFMGIVVVNLIVDSSGMPQNAHILRPAGLGLDENAVEAVSKYRFTPAMEGDKPVPVELNVEVNFQIF